MPGNRGRVSRWRHASPNLVQGSVGHEELRRFIAQEDVARRRSFCKAREFLALVASFVRLRQRNVSFSSVAVQRQPVASLRRPPIELGAATRRVTTLWYAALEMLMLRGRYSFGVDVWALGLVLAEMENNGPVCPTKPGASEWDQLLEARVMCQPEATSSPFTRMAQKDLLCRYPHRALGPKLQRGALGRVYGARFRAVAASCLQFVPAQRVTAIALAEAYQSDCGEVLWPCRLGFFWPYRSQWRQRQGS